MRGGQTDPQPVRSSLGPLTGSRFLAALWVVMYHYSLEFRFASGTEEISYYYGHRNPLDLVILEGHLAVDFFFLLSGFILAYTYVTMEGTLRDGSARFWLARVARIYPVYLLGLALGLGPYLFFGGATAREVTVSGIAHLFMVQTWLPSTLEWNQPSWSLSVEAFFYTLFPLLLPLFAKRKHRGLLALLVGSCTAFGVITLLLAILGGRYGVASIPHWRDIERYNPLVSLPVFTMGMALGLLFVARWQYAVSAARRMGSRASDILLASAAAALVVVFFALRKTGWDSFSLDTVAPFAVPFFAVFIYVLAFQRGAIARLLSHPTLIWLGEISYGIYILHAPLWGLLRHFALDVFHLQPGNVVLIPVYALLLLGVSGLSYTYIERPARRAIRRLGLRKVAIAVPRTA